MFLLLRCPPGQCPCLGSLDVSPLLPGVGLVGETREAEQRLLTAAKDAPAPVLLVRCLAVFGDVVLEVGPAQVGVDVFEFLDATEVLGLLHRGDDTEVVADP
jgi:hypothetical protein